MKRLAKRLSFIKPLNSSGVGHHVLIAVLVVSGFASFGAYRVFSSEAATSDNAPALNAQGLKSDGCIPGEHKNDKNKCEPFVKIEKIKEDCALYKLPYGQDNKRCRTGMCIDGYEKQGVNCVKKRPPVTDPPITDQPEVTTDRIAEKTCKLLGRKPTDANNCKRVCETNAGALLTKNSTMYCQHAVALNITSDYCAQLHRIYVGIGCARLPGQQDTNSAPQCLAGFPYYNANFTPKTGDGTKTDVCEKDKATADKNEKDGLLAGQPVGGTKPDTPTQPDDCSPSDASARCLPQNPEDDGNTDDTEGVNPDFRIILFKDRDFKGDKLDAFAKVNEDGTVGDLTVKVNGKRLDGVTHLGALPRGWNDEISSFKVLKGRWILCEDNTFITNCIKPYASDANLGDAKDKQKNINNKISSARPATHIVLGETIEDLLPICLGSGATYDPETDKCSDGSTLICPPALNGETPIVKDGECVQATVEPTTIVPVDAEFKGKQGERKCGLLGREWISAGNGGEHGCSIETCRNNKDGRPRTVQITGDGEDDSQKRTDTVCISYKHDVPYAVKLDSKAKESKKKCDERNRMWIEQVKLCAQVPNREDKNQTIVKANQCVGKKTTYYIYKEKSKTDECFSPSYFDRAKGVAKSTGGAFSAALKQGPKAYCKVVKGGKYHWQNGKCVIDRHKCWNGQSLPVGQKCPPKPDDAISGDGGDEGSGDKDSDMQQVNCASLGTGRPQNGPYDCVRDCLKDGHQLTNYSDNRWDICYKPERDNGGKDYTATYTCSKAEDYFINRWGPCTRPRACTAFHTKAIDYKVGVHLFRITDIYVCDSSI